MSSRGAMKRGPTMATHMAGKDGYTFDELVGIYRHYAQLKGWSTKDAVVRDKVESWVGSRIGPVGLAIDFHEKGRDKAQHLGYDAEARANNAPIQTLVVTLAGTAHPNRDGTSRQAIAQECPLFDELVLKLEPQNEHDPNAVAVYTSAGQQLGYLPRPIAAETVSRIRTGYKHGAVLQAVEEPMGMDVGSGTIATPADVRIVLFIAKPGVPAAEWKACRDAWVSKVLGG